jgi:large subunit ribosomal protein L13
MMDNHTNNPTEGAKYTIDATDKKLGRVASEAAVVLMGKDKADFARNTLSGTRVCIRHADLLDISEKKLAMKTYARYSGYPGGLKHEPMRKVIEKKGHEEVVRKAVYGMLPGNKLRPQMMKNLTVEN